MAGIGMVLNTAKLAIAAQQNGITVTGHNIANVNSPFYSRQRVTHTPTDPVKSGELYMGTGVITSSVQRSCDQLLEDRLIKLKSEKTGYEEIAAYMDILETSLNENSETGLNNLMNEFWNSWHDVSNNPTGDSERLVVYEKGVHLTERMDTLASDLMQIDTDLNNELGAVVSEVNSITGEIADINNQIIGSDPNGMSHDMLDRRNGLVTELSELIAVNTFEQPDGSLTVTTAGGFNLVTGTENQSLTFNQGLVLWEGSYGGQVDITDRITGGKIHGWLEMRDEQVAKYQTELDAMTKELIWSVNYQHSQGVGLSFQDTAVTGTYTTDTSGVLDTLDFGHKIDYTEDFKMWVENTGGVPATYTSVTTDMAVSTDNPTYPGGDTFGQADATYTITVTGITGTGIVGTDDITFEWTDTVGAGAPVAVNMNGPATTADINGMLVTFAAGDVLVAGNTLDINTSATGDDAAVSLIPTGTANSVSDAYSFTVTSGGTIGTDTVTVDWSNSATYGSFTLDAATTAVTVDGMTLSFSAGRFATDDVFTVTSDSNGSPTAKMMSDWHWTLDSFADQFDRDAIAAGVGARASTTSSNTLTFTPGANEGIAFSDDTHTDPGLMAALGINTFFTGDDMLTAGVNDALSDRDRVAVATIDGATGEFGAGDNSNAMALADLRHASMNIAEWTYERGSDATSQIRGLSLEDYYQTMVTAVGIKSASVHRSVEFAETMVGQLTAQRDSLSAVSLDEEMINLMKYQHAYSVASKLLSVADELLMTLINSKR